MFYIAVTIYCIPIKLPKFLDHLQNVVVQWNHVTFYIANILQ